MKSSKLATLTSNKDEARFKSLPKSQQFALLDMVFRNGLERVEGGFDGSALHRYSVIYSLQSRGLCRCRFELGSIASPTKTGRCVAGADVPGLVYERLTGLLDSGDFTRGSLWSRALRALHRFAFFTNGAR